MELQLLKRLDQRMALSTVHTKKLYRLQKGYEGEVQFHNYLQRYLTSDSIVLYDLLLDENGSSFQLDCTILQQRYIWKLEIKNFEGDFIFKDNTFYNMAHDKEITNPLSQLERSKVLLNQVLQTQGYEFPIKPYVVFVNPQFTLYHAQPNFSIVLPTQIIRFIQTFNKTSSKLTSAHTKLAHQLFSIRKTKRSREGLTQYDFDDLQKGVFCYLCGDLLAKFGRKMFC